MSTRILYAVAEAMRESCAELAARNADINHRNGYVEMAEVQRHVATRIHRIDVGALVGKTLSAPPPSKEETAAFEEEARRLYIVDFRRKDNGDYSYPLAQRFWEMWRAARRFEADERQV